MHLFVIHPLHSNRVLGKTGLALADRNKHLQKE
jgi:hypothetical protein